MTDTLFRTAAEAEQMLRGNEISSRELTEVLLDRIDAVNPALNPIIELRLEEALRKRTPRTTPLQTAAIWARSTVFR